MENGRATAGKMTAKLNEAVGKKTHCNIQIYALA